METLAPERRWEENHAMASESWRVWVQGLLSRSCDGTRTIVLPSRGAFPHHILLLHQQPLRCLGRTDGASSFISR